MRTDFYAAPLLGYSLMVSPNDIDNGLNRLRRIFKNIEEIDARSGTCITDLCQKPVVPVPVVSVIDHLVQREYLEIKFAHGFGRIVIRVNRHVTRLPGVHFRRFVGELGDEFHDVTVKHKAPAGDIQARRCFTEFRRNFL